MDSALPPNGDPRQGLLRLVPDGPRLWDLAGILPRWSATVEDVLSSLGRCGCPRAVAELRGGYGG